MSRQPFFIGTYSVPSPWAGADSGHGAGIVLASVESATGELFYHSERFEPNPAFAVADRTLDRIWAVTEVEHGGELVSWSIRDSPLAIDARSAVTTGADGPCHVTVDSARAVAYVCHFNGGLLSTIALHADGSPAELVEVLALPTVIGDLDRSDLRSRPHCTRLVGEDELLVTDCGRDVVSLYRIEGSGTEVRLRLVDALALPERTGPRHLTEVRADGVFYVSNENSASVSVIGMRGAGDRRLELIQTAPSRGLGRARSLPAEIAINSRRDVVYLANRFDNSISVFDVEPDTGRLAEREAVDVRGDWPRHFALTPDGALLLVGNQNTDTIVSFHIDDSGGLEWSGHTLAVASPASIAYW